MYLYSKILSLLVIIYLLLVPVSVAKTEDVHVGNLSVKKLIADYPVFAEEFNDWQVSDEDKHLMKSLEGKSLLIMYGTWCHDSEREVPRLLKLIDESEVALAKLQLLAVDLDKKEPSGFAKLNRLKYTPTIVLFDGEKELGRIIERPNDSLAKDLAAMSE